MDGSKSMEEMMRLLQEAQQSMEKLKREQQEAERGRQEERQQREKAERRRQEAERRRQEAERRRQEAERGRQEERQQREKAERRQREAEKRAEASEQESQPTTLDEYMAACHSLVFSNLTVEPDPRLTTKGPVANPRNKWCPTNLRPWPDFLHQQRITFGTLYHTLPLNLRVFESRSALSAIGNRLLTRTIACEKSLEYFMHISVEDPVTVIIEELQKVEDVSLAFNLGNGVVFKNHPHAISDIAEEVIDRDTPSTPPYMPGHGLDLNRLRPDQICIYRSDNAGSARNTLVYVAEYKPPHKLTAPHLRLGLRPMNVYEEVVNREIIPTSEDPDARFQYHAERLTAAAITQTYHYMIEGGLEYGLLTTGQATVFLKIDWQQPETLYYHLSEPDAEVLAHPVYSHLCTAVGQHLAFTLMALGPPDGRQLRGQDERFEATKNLKTWTEDFEAALQSISKDERDAPEDSSCYLPDAYEDADRSPLLSRMPTRGRPLIDEPVKEQVLRDQEDSSDDELALDFPGTSSPTETRIRRGSSQRTLVRRPRSRGGKGGRNRQARSYCTQNCLLGLVKGGSLDPGCPNIALHSGQPHNECSDCHGSSRTCARHPVDHTKFIDLLREQLERSLDDGITPLSQGGARGVLFKVTLLAYGYTFVSKGTVQAFVEDLEHEAAVYERLQPIQGINVPVFLGAIDLRSMNRIYYFDHRVYVIYMMFLSWGGYDPDPTVIVGDVDEPLEEKAMRSLRTMHEQGVVHKDVRKANMLFNAEINGVMMIDFERALLVQPHRPRLAQGLPNKRTWKPETMDFSKSAEKSSVSSQVSRAFSEDVMMMKMVF